MKKVEILVKVAVENYGKMGYSWCDVDCPLFEFKMNGAGMAPFCRMAEEYLDEDICGIRRCQKCLMAEKILEGAREGEN